MGRHLGLIIFLLFVVWQIISAVINSVNANKQQQRAQDLAKQRRGEADASGDEQTTPQSRLDDLAARRKAQLEELRRRRETGGTETTMVAGPTAAPQQRIDPTLRTASPGRSSNPSPGSSSSSSQRPTQPPPTRTTRRAQSDPWRDRKDAMQREQDAKKARQAQQKTKLEKQRQAQQATASAQQEAAVVQRQRVRADRAARDAAEEAALLVPEVDSIRSKVHDTNALREMFIIKELLDRPLSLRNPEQP
jgi:hypothetical protein